MLTRYSKPPNDVAAHTARLIADNDALLARQRRISKALSGGPKRNRCLVCSSALADAGRFVHRRLDYLVCTACDHVQSAALPPAGYPEAEQDFADIYRPLDKRAYRQKREQIFNPKLEWIVGAAEQLGLSDVLARPWVDLGSGDGCFISSLLEMGARQVVGLEAEGKLVEQAKNALGRPLVRKYSKSLAEAVRDYPADIYSAWFVLEHCFELPAFCEAIRARPTGSLIVFSVPTVGFATLLENIFAGHYARSLDGVLHLQLFTDRSIHRAMDIAGCEIIAEWVFGQDADDLYRALTLGVAAQSGLSDTGARFSGALAEIQQAIDHNRLADARHVMAVRR